MHLGFYMLLAAFLLMLAQVGYAMYQLTILFS
jgi:hypothetical protein